MTSPLYTVVTLTLPILLALGVARFCSRYYESQHSKSGTAPTHSRSYWLIGSVDFFRNPYAFIESNISQSKGQMFSFKILRDTVIVVRGIPGRNAFFSKGLDFMSGYRLLNPQLVDIMPKTEISGDESWASFMANFIRTEVLEKLYPSMLEDVSRRLDATWGDTGSVNPFESVYELVFALSMRLSTCREFCDDPTTVRSFMRIFADLEAGSTPTSIIMSWIPTPSRIRRTLAGAKLYRMIDGVVRDRKRQRREEDDPLQVLIDKNLSVVEITRFVAMMLFAAVTNTGNVLCWTLIYLEVHKEWKSRVMEEIKSFIQDTSLNSDKLVDNIAAVPFAEMDHQTPSLDYVINETIRLLFIGTFMRRNIGEDILVDGTRIKHGTYLMFPTADLHFNEDIFPDPTTFDPLRFTLENATKRNEKGINYLGWGAARHVCVGKRAAMLMMKMVTVLLMSKYDIRIVDDAGKPIEVVPETNSDMLFKVCQTKSEVFLEYVHKDQGA
ncbi:cytochrome P450 [Mycena floridula]|nr:cytochrome P450 [Mycena floridula]